VPVCAAAQAVLAEVQAKLEADGAQVEELQRIQVMAGEMLAGAHAPVAAAAARLAQEMRAAWDRLTAGAPALPTAGGEAAGAVERALLPPLMEAVRDLAGRFDGALDGVLAALWKQPGSALHRALQGRVRRPPEPDWPARLKHLTATLENAACAAVAQSGVAEHCQGIIRRRRLVRGMTAGGLALGTAMVAAGLSGILPWAGAVLTGLGLSGVVVWQVGRRTAPPATGPALAEAGRRLEEETLALAQEHGTRRLADFSPLLDPLPEVIQFRKGNLIPLLAESAQLALTLQNLARALQPDRSAAPPPDRL
jgi:hypothetical protein